LGIRRRGLYERYIPPPLIGLACGSKPIDKQRQKIVPLAQGVVLELLYTAVIGEGVIRHAGRDYRSLSEVAREIAARRWIGGVGRGGADHAEERQRAGQGDERTMSQNATSRARARGVFNQP
jgi:hypothetical protein